MNLKAKVAYWLESAKYDLDTAQSMLETGRYAYVAFMCQQYLEKTLKAIYLKKFGKEAPRSHNLLHLAKKVDLKLEKKIEEFFLELTSYYIECRYPDYQKKIAAVFNKNQAKKIMQETQEIFKWLGSLI